jgi:hypothetical protein
VLGPLIDSRKPNNNNNNRAIDLSDSIRMCCCSSSSSSSLGPPPGTCCTSSSEFTEPPTPIVGHSAASLALGGSGFLLCDDAPAAKHPKDSDVDLLGWVRKTIVRRTDLEAIRNILMLDDADDDATKTPKKRVQFEHVNVRYYSQVLGNNPACRDGAPIELSWNYFDEQRLPLDDFDARHRRHRTDFKLTALQRSYRLASLGYTRQQVMEAQRHVQHVQRQRRATRAKLGSIFGRLQDRLQERTEAFYASSAVSIRNHKTRQRLLPQPLPPTTAAAKSSCEAETIPSPNTCALPNVQISGVPRTRLCHQQRR